MAKSRSRIENDDCSSSPNYLTSMRGDEDQLVSHLFKGINSISTITRSGWCLKDGTNHLLQACNGIFRPIVEAEGVLTSFLSSKEVTCFQSICRAISSQGYSNKTAKNIWKRLSAFVGNDFCPEKVLTFKDRESYFQKGVGLSLAKVRAIIYLSVAFVDGTLSELMLKTGSEKDIRDALLPIRGIGPWTVDMFLIFHLHLPDVLPLGDLVVREGIADLFSIKGKGKNGSLHEKKDSQKMIDIMKPFAPYQSLAAMYFWKVRDSKTSESSGNEKMTELNSSLKKNTMIAYSKKSSGKKKATKTNSSLKKNTMSFRRNKREGNIAKCSGSMDTPVAKRSLRRKVTP